MSLYLSKIISHFKSNPKHLFLIDALGALLTSFMLLVVLYQLQRFVGIPKQILRDWGQIGLLFSAYSSCCYLFAGSYWRIFLRILSLANLSYCLFTTTTAYILYQIGDLTPWGIAYFCIEITIILPLVFVEYKTSNLN